MSEKHTDRPVFRAAQPAARQDVRQEADEKTIAMIGGTSGLGRQAVEQLVALGHQLIVVGRNAARGADLAGKAKDKITFVAADISTLSGMRHAVDQIREWAQRSKNVESTPGSGRSHDRRHLDVLINNAGVLCRRRELTEDGLEMNFAVHHVAPFVITGRLLDLLTPGGRVVNVNSVGHMAAMRSPEPIRIRFEDLPFDHGYEATLAYSCSKLANLMFTYELQRRHGDRLTVNALHPGQVRTDLGREYPRPMVMAMQALQMATFPAEGARPVVHLAISDEGGRAGGRYFDRYTETRSSAASYDKGTAMRLWEVTEQLAGPFIPSENGALQ